MVGFLGGGDDIGRERYTHKPDSPLMSSEAPCFAGGLNPPQSQTSFLLIITLLTTSHLSDESSLNLTETVYEKLDLQTHRILRTRSY